MGAGPPTEASVAVPTDTDDVAEHFRAGDSAALGEFFARHRDRLWRVVEFRFDARLRPRLDADDVLQQAYIEAAKRLGHFRGETATAAFVWLRLVVVQTLVDLHRAHLGTGARDASREVGLDPQAGTGDSAALAHHLAESLTSPSRAASRGETERQLRAALDELEPVDREVLTLRHFEELTNAEAAAVLGLDAKAASKRYVRALDRLRGVLEAPGGA
jgi:RNA polymerase sigma-70 factor (ECF subfamily)